MFSRDYLVRQLQQFIQALSMVLLHKQNSRQDLALEVIHNTLMDVLGVSRAELNDLDREGLVRLVSRGDQLRHDEATALAALLEEDPEPSAHLRAAWLYEAVLATGGAVPLDVHERIERLRESGQG